MLSIWSEAAFSRTKCSRPTIPPTGWVWIIWVCLPTQMTRSTQLAQRCGSLYIVGISTAYSWGWGQNIHCSVFLHLLERFDILFPAGRHSWNWRISFGGGQMEYNTGKDGTRPWKVLSSSLSVYWQQMFVRARTPAFGLIGIRMVIMVYGCKRGLEW